MKRFYPDAHESIPVNAPVPRGPSVLMTAFVDADHAGDMLTRRSYSGIVIYLMNTPVVWYCKKQNTVEASTFESEFNAMRE